jgi:hypothetical protein
MARSGTKKLKSATLSARNLNITSKTNVSVNAKLIPNGALRQRSASKSAKKVPLSPKANALRTAKNLRLGKMESVLAIARMVTNGMLSKRIVFQIAPRIKFR